jgi:hypothetical protein
MQPESTEILPATPRSVAASDGFFIYNEGSGTAYYADSQLPNGQEADYYHLFQNRKLIPPATPVQIQSDAYIWRSMTGPFTFTENWQYGGISAPQTQTINFPYPDLYIQHAPGATMGFNVSAATFSFRPRTDLYLWLNDLLNSNKYDAAWPEYSYTGEQALAYKFILSKIPGNTPPKNGSVRPTDISTIAYPNDGTFSQAVFTEVQNHLITECSDFATVTQWFGTGGILYAINTQIAVVSSNDLQGIAQLMEVPQNSIVSLILDAVFNDIIRIIGLIPEIGPVISTVLYISWTSAQVAIGTSKTGQPIQISVAEMADTLNQYLQYVDNATQAQMATLFSNYGKLVEFSNGVVEGKISEKNFFPSDQPPVASQPEDKHPLPQGYINAAAKAWKITIYKYLLSTQPTDEAAECYVVTTIPPQTWNPVQGGYSGYKYIWYLDAQIQDPKGNLVTGYLSIESVIMYSNTVKQALFGPNSDLNVNPIELFMGVNGWPAIALEIREGIPYNWPATQSKYFK